MVASFIAGCLVCWVGFSLYLWRSRSRAVPRPEIPKEWPLVPRLLVNSKERRIWNWLAKVMFDQQIMIKLPVTRFTIPSVQDEAEHWYTLLNRVYCTFTVCNSEGRIVGCVDVPGRDGLSLSNQTLKYGLLARCGIPYWVVEPENLPHMQQIRAAFLGDQANSPSERERMNSHLKDVAGNLHAAVLRQRASKHHASMESQNASVATDHDALMTAGWEQNSFVVPLDSRSAALNAEP